MRKFAETIQLLENSHFYYVVIIGMDGNFSYINTKYANTFNSIENQIVGKPYYVTMHPDDRNICEEIAVKCFKFPDQSFPATIRKHNGKGGYMITQWEYHAMDDENSQPSGIFCIGYDITEYINVNQQLKVAKTEIEHKENILKQISWQQSHVLRKPVANILGLVSVLNNMEVDQNLNNICLMLAESANELDSIIQDIIKKRIS